MHKSVLELEVVADSATVFRAIFKPRHGRVLFLSLDINGPSCSIRDCFYIDRNQGREGAARYKARPNKLRTLQFPTENLLAIIEAEFDKKFYGVEFVETNQAELSLDEYLQFRAESAPQEVLLLDYGR